MAVVKLLAEARNWQPETFKPDILYAKFWSSKVEIITMLCLAIKFIKVYKSCVEAVLRGSYCYKPIYLIIISLKASATQTFLI